MQEKSTQLGIIHADELQHALNDPPQQGVQLGRNCSHPPSIHREVSSQFEQQKCNVDQRHSMYGLTAAPSRLKSGKSFLRTVPPLDKDTTRQLKTQNLWKNCTDNILRNAGVPLKVRVSQFENH